MASSATLASRGFVKIRRGITMTQLETPLLGTAVNGQIQPPMPIFGTITNGLIRLDHLPDLPEGTRVMFDNMAELEEDDFDDLPIPEPTETREQFLASLKQAHDEAMRGEPGFTIQEAMAIVRESLEKGAQERLLR